MSKQPKGAPLTPSTKIPRPIRLPSRRSVAIVILSILALLLLLLWAGTYKAIERQRQESLSIVKNRLETVNSAIFMQVENKIALIGSFMDNAFPDEKTDASGKTLPLTQALWVDAGTGAILAALRPPGSGDRAAARQAAASAIRSTKFETIPREPRNGPDRDDGLIRLVRAAPKQPATLQLVILDHQKLVNGFEPLLQHIATLRLYAGDTETMVAQIIGGTGQAETSAPTGALAARHGPGLQGIKVESTYPFDNALAPYEERITNHLLTALLGNLLLIAIALFALRLAEYFRQYGLQLEIGRMHAEQASQIKTRFISQISHELRTPLHGIIGYADLIQQESTDPTQRESAAAILQSGEHLLVLVNRLLDAAKIETGERSEWGNDALTLMPIDLVPMVKQIVFGHEATARRKSLATYVNSPTSLPVIADRVALGQILHNLLSNALKFTLKGGIRIEVKRLPDTARVEIIDTGIGIDPEDQTRLFGMFVQGSSVDLSRFGGTGLGLYLTKQLVEGMGGEIGFQSNLNGGTTFWFELPLADTELPTT